MPSSGFASALRKPDCWSKPNNDTRGLIAMPLHTHGSARVLVRHCPT